MPSIKYDIYLDENRDNSFTFRWFDSAGDPVDLTGMGALAEVVDENGTVVSRIDNTDGITLHQPGDPNDPDEGKIQITFPRADLTTLPFDKYDWELVIYPTSGSPTVNPTSLLKGYAYSKREHANLTV